MQDESCHSGGRLDGPDAGVRSTTDGLDILSRQSDTSQSLACQLGFGKADLVRQTDVYYWRIVHNPQVDNLLVELIDLLIPQECLGLSVRYAHPSMVQPEMFLEPDEP